MTTILARARFLADHRWTPRHMSAYLDDELPSSGRDRLERHIIECEECRRLLAGLRATLDALHRLPALGGGPDTQQLVAAVRLQLQRGS